MLAEVGLIEDIELVFDLKSLSFSFELIALEIIDLLTEVEL